MTAPDWVFARVFNDSGVHIADVQSPFESILKGVFAWLTNATSPDAAKMQSLYIPAHCNYEEDRIAFSSINPAYRAAQLKHIRHDFTSLSKTVTVHHTIEKADDLLGFVKTDRNHPEAPELYFTTLALQMMSLSTTDMERQHLYLAIFIVCFRELAYLLGRWKYGTSYKGTSTSSPVPMDTSAAGHREDGERIEKRIIDGGLQPWNVSGDGHNLHPILGYRYCQFLATATRSSWPGYYVLSDSDVHLVVEYLLDSASGFCPVPFFHTPAKIRLNSTAFEKMLAAASASPSAYPFTPQVAASATSDTLPALDLGGMQHAPSLQHSPLSRRSKRVDISDDSIVSEGPPTLLFSQAISQIGSDSPILSNDDVTVNHTPLETYRGTSGPVGQGDQEGLVVHFQRFCELV